MFDFDQEMNRRGFIAAQVAPVFESAVQAGTYGRVPLKQLLKEPEVGRNSRGEYNRTNFTFEDAVFATKERGIEIPVDRRQAKMYASFFDFEMVCAAQALDIVLRAAEKRVADAIFNATTFASYTAAVGTPWTIANAATATPTSDVETAVRAVWAATGIWCNALIINRHVFRALRYIDDITDKVASLGAGASVEPGKITTATLASVFDLPKIIVAGSARDSANEGQAASITNVWSSSYAMVARVNEPGDSIEVPGLARTIHWGEDGSTIGGTIETYYEDSSRGDVVRVRHDVQEKIMYADSSGVSQGLGYLLSNIS
jgi:hypothetical protein